MSTSKREPRPPRAVGVKVSGQSLTVDLADGRTLVTPVAWYPRLLHGTPAERSHWMLVGGGEGMQWPDLDEDISVEGLLAGLPSGESPASLTRWLAGRRAGARKEPGRPVGAGRGRDASRPGRRPGKA